ncbi:MAG: type II toxin-antitoxin system RelE/ParE family toxin [bacterium]
MLVVITELASNDIKDIAHYTFENFGYNKANEYLMKLNSVIQDLLVFPNLGKQTLFENNSVFSMTVDGHVIIYIATNTEIIVIRILPFRKD